MKKSALLVFTIFVVYFTQAQKKIMGNGNVLTIERNTDEYDNIQIGGFYEVELVNGNEGKITLKGEENILEYIETEVKSGTLIIKSKNNMNLNPSRDEGVFITIPVNNVDGIRLSGSGKLIGKKTLEATDFKVQTSGSRNAELKVNAESVTVIASGSSTINLIGVAEKVKVTSSGSSNLNAFDLLTERVEIQSSGSSNIGITAKESINSVVSGSGNIRYRGNPGNVQSIISGSGHVSKE